MSLEFQLAWHCPHLTVEEVVTLDIDRRSLLTRQPLGGVGQVRILINDEFQVPQSGVFSPAVLSSSVSGPFDIRQNEDVFTVTASTGVQTITFGASGTIRKTTDQVVALIKALEWTHVTVVNENGFLVITDSAKVGPDAFVKVSGSVAASLGFGQARVSQRQRAVWGREVYPGWNVYQRPDTQISNRFPKFNKMIRTNPVIKVTYTVPWQRCVRCGGTQVENDYRFDAGGNVILIKDEDLLYQAALKILLTDLGSNPFHSWYGTTIRQRIGSKALSGVAAVLSEDVRRALSRMQNLQRQQAKYQTVSFKERLYAVLGVQVQQHRQDPSTFLIEVTVQNASSEPIRLNIVFTVPEVVALMGSNGLMLGTEAAGLGVTESRELFRSDRNLLTGGQ